MMGRWHIAGKLLRFFWQERMWWLVPMVVVLLIVAGLVWVTASTPLAPFIYTLF